MPHVSWLRFDMHILESNILQLYLRPFLSQKPFFFYFHHCNVFFKFFFYRHCCCCNFEIAQTTLQRDTIQLAREWMGGACNSELCRWTNQEHRNSIILGRRSFQASTRETHTATTTKWLNIKPWLLSKNCPDVIKIVITNNSARNCNLISHFVQ